jgi:N-carbamoylputrescine amidase
MTNVVLGLIQMQASADPETNLRNAVQKIREAAQKGAQIICLQELFRTPYFCQSEDHENFKCAEPIPGPTTKVLADVARRENVVIIAPVFEKRVEGIYHNSAAVIDADGTLLGTYRKMHIPEDPCFYEKFYFAPGDKGFQVFATKYARIGVLICWDQWFPEAARLTALRNAQILFYPTAIGWHASDRDVFKTQLEAWQVVQRGHAVANEVFVAVANRVGRDGELTFWGNSFVAGPFGQMLATASQEKEESLIVPCDLTQIEQTRQHWPFFRDRRIDAYSELTSRFLDED